MHLVSSRSVTPHDLILFSHCLLRLHVVEEHVQDLSATLPDVLQFVTRLQLEESTNHAVRLADYFKVSSNAFSLRRGRQVVRRCHSLLVGLDIDVKDELLENLELLSILVHSH